MAERKVGDSGLILELYDPEKRKKEVEEALQKHLKESIERIRAYAKELQSQPRSDVCTLYLMAKKMEADDLHEEIKSFDNPGNHFTKRYRVLHGHCGKLQTDMDGVDVIGRDDLKDMRKKVLEHIERMLKELEATVHESGRPCKECTIRD